jgi:hypothetical protein
MDGGGVDTSGSLNFFAEPDANSCCELCYDPATQGCDLWFFFPGFGCFLVQDADGPPETETSQCPSGEGEAVAILGAPGDTNVGGLGPCGTGFIS